MLSPKVSIIVPVYNVEKYLNRCVDSIINQTYKNIEIILVDDGSKDSSPQICDDYAKKDERIVVIHKENGGLSSARNCGINYANGEFLLFIDSDDFYLENTLIEKLNSKQIKTSCDVVVFSFKYFYEDNKVKASGAEFLNEIDDLNKTNQFEMLMKTKYYCASAWNKYIRKSTLICNNIFFNEGVFSEDIDWSARLALHAKSFSYINSNAYAYYQNSNSITHNIGYKNLFDIFSAVKNCLSYLENQKLDDDFKQSYLKYVSFQYSTLFVVAGFVNDKRKKDILNEMKRYIYLLKYSNNKKVRALYFVNKYLGYKTLVFLTRIYARIK